jgi:hypothetical protein
MSLRILFILLLPLNLHAQGSKSGFAALFGQLFVSEKMSDRTGINVAAGFGNNKKTIGPSIDFYIFGNNSKFLVSKIDLRYFFNGLAAKSTVFVSGQAGWVAYNHYVYSPAGSFKTTGSFAFDLLGGFLMKVGQHSPGVYAAGGASVINFKTKYDDGIGYESYVGGKLQIGFRF